MRSCDLGITHKNYIHIFTSLKITLSKKFKINMLNNPCFMNCFFFLAIDEIYLVEEESKSFHLLYIEIEKVQKCILSQVSLLGVSTILIRSIYFQILTKNGFRNDYKLIQTLLDCPKIQIHCFIAYPKLSFLDF